MPRIRFIPQAALHLVLSLGVVAHAIAQPPFGQRPTDFFAPNWPEQYMLWQQRSLFPPMPSLKGLVEHPAMLDVLELNHAAYQRAMADDLFEQGQQPMHHWLPVISAAERNAAHNPSQPTVLDAHDELRQLVQDLNEAAAVNGRLARSGHYASAAYREDLTQYEQAHAHLAAMLDGRAPPSIADAVYTAEAAFGNLPLSREAFQQEIARSSDFIRRWLRENRLNARDPEALHLGIQRFMGDTLSLRGDPRADAAPQSMPPHHHTPFVYDYIDCRGEQDPRNLFLTKALATGTGQCANLPLVYLVLAEALGAEAHLSFAPQHSFIKYRNNAGAMQNYETTVHWHLSDNEYMEHMPVMAQALASGVYLHPLSQRQTIAAVLIDLAYHHKREHGPANSAFLLKCIDRGLKEFPGGEARGLYLSLIHI